MSSLKKPQRLQRQLKLLLKPPLQKKLPKNKVQKFRRKRLVENRKSIHTEKNTMFEVEKLLSEVYI